MLNTLITYLQVFGIGFSFGMAGPCFLVCAPVIVTYVTASKKNFSAIFKDIVTFLFGRLLAYLTLGAIAGLSGAALKKYTSSGLAAYFQPLAGAVTIFFAILVLVNKYNSECSCPRAHGKIFNFGGIFAFGFLIGLSPCAPLLALLFDIALICKSVLDSILYALAFGLGTFLSGLITVGIISGLLTRIPAALIKSRLADMIFRIICAGLLLALGISMLSRTGLNLSY